MSTINWTNKIYCLYSFNSLFLNKHFYLGSIQEEVQEAKQKNLIYHILTKSQQGKLVLAAYDYDQKYKDKFKKFDNYTHKLADLLIDYEFMNQNFEYVFNNTIDFYVNTP